MKTSLLRVAPVRVHTHGDCISDHTSRNIEGLLGEVFMELVVPASNEHEVVGQGLSGGEFLALVFVGGVFVVRLSAFGDTCPELDLLGVGFVINCLVHGMNLLDDQDSRDYLLWDEDGDLGFAFF